MAKLRPLLHNWLIALDQKLFVEIAGVKYLFFNGHLPSPQETISSKIGRSYTAGARWAKPAMKIVDGLFELLGSRPGHCIRCMVAEDDWNY